jgi:membrane associated rhomboid family serine protease
VEGLPGIIFSPLLHGSLSHLVANALSLFTLLVILYGDKQYKADQTLIWIWILCGIGTWLIGRAGSPRAPMAHIGASGVIYGLVVYLIAAAWWLHSWRAFFMGVLVLFFYGGIFYGVLPQRGIISWEGHLSGAIEGFITAYRIHA